MVACIPLQNYRRTQKRFPEKEIPLGVSTGLWECPETGSRFVPQHLHLASAGLRLQDPGLGEVPTEVNGISAKRPAPIYMHNVCFNVYMCMFG